MVLLQQTQNIPLDTFGDFSEFILSRIVKDAEIIYFVTDRYITGSIKTYERMRRKESGSIRYKIERRDQKRTKQWAKYLKDSNNKTDLVNFLFDDWSDPFRFASKLRGKTLFVNVEQHFYKLSCPQLEVKTF